MVFAFGVYFIAWQAIIDVTEPEIKEERRHAETETMEKKRREEGGMVTLKHKFPCREQDSNKKDEEHSIQFCSVTDTCTLSNAPRTI